MKKSKRILVAPLNWGLGHASRCVPVIYKLIENDCEVIIAADGAALELLRREFPKLQQVILPGIKTKYSKFIPIPLLVLLRAPRLFQSIKSEHQTLLKLVKIHKIDGVISDNRYGLFHPKIPSVIITHQLNVKTPFFKKKSKTLLESLIAKFSTCWVPDFVGNENLSGELSHSITGLKNLKYIGTLSRFKYQTDSNTKFKHKLLILLSGPEPARTTLEDLLLDQLQRVDYEVLVVRGKFTKHEVKSKSNIKSISFLDADELELEINNSELVLCRSGYSSIMDMARMGKKVLFVPTPGQTEQEYLAEYIMGNKQSYAIEQSKLDLAIDVTRALKCEPLFIQEDSSFLEESIKSFLNEL